jgi:peptidyl-prolyl cis-trans isomerase A (cyclophilin A)
MNFPAIQVPGTGQLYARLITNQGTLVVLLHETLAPKTVANFVGLAVGTIAWRDALSGQTMHNTPMYDGVRFHRVIPNFMIQCGDPLSRSNEPRATARWGTGGPGYQFEDEFQSGRGFDKPCLMAMANSGPNTNGSQFFITEVATKHLNGKHTIFGEVVKGCELVAKIARVPAEGNRPSTSVVIKKVVLADKAP